MTVAHSAGGDTTVADPAMTRIHRAAAWGSLALDFSDGHCTIVAGGDTQCDPVRIEHGPGLSWSAYQGDRLIAKQAPCISRIPWPKEHG